MMEFSLVIPCFNEEEAVPDLCKNLRSLLDSHGGEIDAEIIMVDDGSRDRTRAVFEDAARNFTNARVVSHERNMGLGAAMRTGLREAHRDIIVYYDSDCSYPVEDITVLVKLIHNGADIATVSPYHKRGGVAGASPLRIFLSRGVSLLYGLVLIGYGARLATYSAMVRAYKKSVLNSIDFKSDGFLATSEIIALAIIAGYKVAEHPSVLRGRTKGVSKMRIMNTVRSHLNLLSVLLAKRLTGVEKTKEITETRK